MSTIDYIYRFDPAKPGQYSPPRDAEAAKRSLEDGNRKFSRWMEARRTLTPAADGPDYVVPCNGLDLEPKVEGGVIKQSPFAVVVGCSDARVPTEMLFGQGFNDLFVVRVAGNVLGDVCQGSIDFAVTALSHSVKVIVVLGHSGCGAVAGAVDSYLEPSKFWAASTTPMLRAILERILVAVREAANGIKEVWGVTARDNPNYRKALIETAVVVNAAMAAFDLRQKLERRAPDGPRVLYGVFNLEHHQVSLPPDPRKPVGDDGVNLADAPADAGDFRALAVRMAEILRPGA